MTGASDSSHSPKVAKKFSYTYQPFQEMAVRPRIGEVVSFEVGTGPDGRKRADAVETAKYLTTKEEKPKYRQKRALLGAVLTMAAIIVIGFVGYNSYADRQSTYTTPSTSTDLESWNRAFSCDGRKHCSQMTSCAEARYFPPELPRRANGWQR